MAKSYFGHAEFAPFSPGLKSLEDAQAIRNKLLGAYETAETASLPQGQHRREVILQWAWTYITGKQGSRLILDAPVPAPPAARPGP